MTTTHSAPSPTPERGLNEVEREVLRRTAAVRADLLRAAAVARKNGTSYVVFGLLTIVLSFTSDPAGFALGAVLMAVGFNARVHGARLAHAELTAPQRLASGEIALLLAVIAYSAAKMTIMRTSGAELAAMVGSSPVDIDVEGLVDSMTNVVYPAVVLIAFVYQGGLAMYYRARRTAVTRYIDDTPAWARDIVAIVSG